MNTHHHAVAAKATGRSRAHGKIAIGSLTILAALLTGCGGGGSSDSPANQQGSTGAAEVSSSSQGRAQAAAVLTTSATEPYVTDAMSDARAGIQTQAIADWDTSRLYYRPTIKGTVRYVDSNTGQDVEASAGGGTMAKPWKTLNYASLRLGGVNMLLLRCGSIWRESLILNKPPAGLVVGAYDADAATPTTLKACAGDKRPVILGANALTPGLWQPAGLADATIYQYPLTTTSEQNLDGMYYMGRPMLKARWPNIVGPDANWPREGGVIGKEFAVVDAILGSDGKPVLYRDRFKLKPADLADIKSKVKDIDKDLIGATVHVHTEAWLLESAKVIGFDKDTGIVTLGEFFNFWGARLDENKKPVTGFENAIQPNSGYLLEGKDWMLDTPGEWLVTKHPTTGSSILLAKLPLNGAGQAQDPRNLAKPTPTMAVAPLEIAVRDVGVNPILSGAKIQIERLQVERVKRVGIHADQTPGAVIKDVTVRHAPIGILASRDKADPTLVAGPNIQHALVQNTSYAGISVVNFENTVVAYNQVLDTGLYTSAQGFEQAPAQGAVSGIHVNGKGALVERNLVNRASNAGIIVQNSFLPQFGLIGVRIQHNTVRRPCVRVTDCGGIYVSGYFKDATAATFPVTEETYYLERYRDVSPKPRGAEINNNHVYNAASNMDGKYGKVRDGAVGIYLDALSARATVRDNLISGTETGIKLHNAYDNLITGNTVRNVTYTSLQAAQSDIDTFDKNVMWGNTVEHNHFYSHRTMTGETSLPTDGSLGLKDQKVFAQQWGRSIDPDGNRTKELFTEIDTGWEKWGKKPGNVSRNNDVLTTAGPNGNSWHTAQNGSVTALVQSAGAVWTSGVGTIPPQLTLQAWQEMTTSNDTVQPTAVSFKVFTTTGTSDVALTSWGYYLAPNGVGNSVNLGATCPSTQTSCMRLVSAAVDGKTVDHLHGKLAPVTIDPTDNLYLVRYTAETGAGGAIPTAVVRQANGPWANLGMYTPLDTVLKSGQVMRVEQFFRFKQSEQAPALALQALPQAGQINPEVFFGQVSLTKVPYQGLSLLTPATLRSMTRHVLNPSSQPISVNSCEKLGWPTGCTALNEQGQALSWPISVPARGSVYLLRRDDTWMQFVGTS
ncbi:MAG TPA: right-handed parallel beta-helix repeat-containing protein [Aquabacterium sp.]|uniref:right-handed parallel beta-helix repeat-containing protein n=1 Tax=Aquabacterium sp. TaxID=1872578 RepID=UPI002E31A4C7|nr:right-handed parallel beta-helix repeat-containing protein [Aquabacterium sp.]HEX5356976.1 right-handed parallel beta-helix repeat-containing protein [Aquabacterium sp.]